MPRFFGNQVVRGTTSKAQTTAGTTQATAQAMVADCVYIPTVSADGAGIIIQAAPAETFGWIINAGASAIYVYPPVGSTMNGVTNGAVNLPAKASMSYWFFDSTTIGASPARG